MQITGVILSGISIFLPGILLIFFVYPICEQLKQIKSVKLSIKGITYVAVGLIISTAIILITKNVNSLMDVVIIFATIILLQTKKLPAPIIVIFVILAGIIL